ncbi:uncharacterized protein LOC109594077 [Aethina tumida]|uniref:uncharacterized protein LOC109594077 n=1 Tax=Aethina tumida TaxID=116153 RepID=UPI00096ADF34|nr:uncharacterized protein LOC109594077 [Aethina tumida]
MSTIHWNARRTFYAVILVTIYLLLRVKKYEYVAKVFLQRTDPKVAWEYVADFSNMKYLNPTIVDFNILSESGNLEHWKYSTEYKENLSHWPYTSNIAVAHFDVKSDLKHQNYLVHSIHSTCFLSGLFCLDSESNFKFSKNYSTPGTLCEEEITYECPVILSSFCKREVEYQRNAIMKNLKRKFL